jgi:hypothetical protein
MPTKAYKGFQKDLTCRSFQYEIGKTYTHNGPVVRCTDQGFHSVEMPFDAWSYYPPNTSRYAEVEADGAIDRVENDDSKIASAVITIKADLRLPDMIKRAAEWIVAAAKTNLGSGYSGHAAATGDSGHAAATGYRGHAAATGYRGHAAATGDRGHAAATGYRGHAAATGDSGHAAATGDSGHAAATGDSGHAAATGDSGHAAATGDSGHAAATGDSGHAAATGYRGHAAATGYRGHAAATGYRGHAAVSGKNAIAAALGYAGTATAGEDGWLVLAYYDDEGKLKKVKTAKVGTEGIKPGKTYRLSPRGKFAEVK